MRHIKQFILSSILMILSFVSAFGQNGATLSGSVRERLVTAPNVGKKVIVGGANITLTSQKNETIKYTTTAADDGNFRFENIPAGEYVLSGMRQTNDAAFEIRDSRQIRLRDGKPQTANLLLQHYTKFPPQSGVVLPKVEVVVVASGTEQKIDEISKSVNVVEAQEMRDRADFSLVESLKTVPGLRVQQLGGFGRAASVKTRGLRSQDTAILLDGVRFRDAAFITGDASPFLSDLTLTSVSRLEILRGSGSSLYGTNAVGGVVDFRTPVPRAGFHGQISGAGGGYGLKRLRGNLSQGFEKFGYAVGVSRTIYTEGIDRDDAARNTNFQTRVEFNPFSKTNISGRVFLGDSFVKLNSNPDTIGSLLGSNSEIIEAAPLSIAELERYANGTPASELNAGSATFIPDANDPDAFQKSRFFSGQAALAQALSNRVVWHTTYQFLQTSRKNTNGTSGVGFQPFGGAETSVFAGAIHTLNSRLDWTINENNLLTVGYEYESERFTSEGLTPFAANNFETRAAQTSNTLYVQDQLNFFKRRLQISGAFRARFFSLKTPEFSSPNAPYQNLMLENPPNSYTADGSIAYFFEQSGTKIRAHVGNGYRVPSLYERFGTFYDTFSVPNGFVALGDPSLKPERSVGFDAGIDQNLFGDRARLSATYFYTHLRDTIGYENTVGSVGDSPRFFGGYLNVPGGISRGAEFSGEIKPSNATTVFASYTFTNSDQRAPQVPGSGILQTLGVPAHQFTLVATQRFAKRFTVNFDFLATSNYLAPIFSNATFNNYIYRFRGARKGDVTVSYEIPANKDKLRFRIFGTIENVFDNDYYENGFRTFGRNGRVGAALSF